MSELPFDLKYRPRRFDQVLGNAGVVQLLLIRSRAGTLADQSMLFGGPKGCGKTSLARIVARAILCTSLDNGEPCGSCPSCEGVLNDSASDVEELDAASQGTVDKIRSMVRDTDYEDGKKIYVVDEAQRLTAQAQDAMLKAMEERLLMFIMCTTESHKIKTPIRSRTEEYPIGPPPPDALLAHLQHICVSESIQADPEALKIIVRMQEACPRTCVMALSTLGALGPITVQTVSSFFRFDSFSSIDRVLSFLDKNAGKAFEVLDALAASENPSWIRDQIVAAISSAMRFDVGARPTYPVSTHFFESRLHGWYDLARALSSMDKPTMPDIEAALLASGSGWTQASPQRVPQAQPAFSPTPPAATPAATPPVSPPAPVSTPVPVVSTSLSAPAPVSTPAKMPTKPPQASRSLEVDGVKFSVDERLTSLDNRIEHGSGAPEPPPVRAEHVEFVRENVPISDKEFTRALVGRIKGSR